MTGTDVTLYRLTSTFARDQDRYGATALTISEHPAGRRQRPSRSLPATGSRSGPDDRRLRRHAARGPVDLARLDPLRHRLRHHPRHLRLADRRTPPPARSSGSTTPVTTTAPVVHAEQPVRGRRRRQHHRHQGRATAQETYWFTTCLTSTRTIDLNDRRLPAHQALACSCCAAGRTARPRRSPSTADGLAGVRPGRSAPCGVVVPVGSELRSPEMCLDGSTRMDELTPPSCSGWSRALSLLRRARGRLQAWVA